MVILETVKLTPQSETTLAMSWPHMNLCLNVTLVYDTLHFLTPTMKLQALVFSQK